MSHSATLKAAGLSGWCSVVKWMDETADAVAILTSPDFNPATRSGRLFAGRGRDPEAALEAAIAKVRAAG